MKLWIARDKSGLLFLYEGYPQRNDRYFYNTPTGNSVRVEEDLFPELTWENSPQEVELKLVNEIVGIAESPLKTFPRVNEFETGASYRR